MTELAPGIPGHAMETIDNRGLEQRVVCLGSGPLVLLLHGWPESWYSWRHQIPTLAAAGYRVVAPDMRGYGGTAAPAEVTDYDILHLKQDIDGLIDRYDEGDAKGAYVIGHDWGSIVAWQYALMTPERCRGLATLSVPWAGRGPMSLVDLLERTWGENFFYILYFQEPGVAEAEFDADPEAILKRLYVAPGVRVGEPEVTDPKRAAGGWIPRLGEPLEEQAWLKASDLAYYTAEFTRAGFRGGINYYRNFRRNWELIEPWAEEKIRPATLFLAGSHDQVLMGRDRDGLFELMGPVVLDLRDVTLLPGAGHWIQQERPREVSQHLIAFLDALEKSRSA